MKLAERFGHQAVSFIYKPDPFWVLPECKIGLEWEWEQATVLADVFNFNKKKFPHLELKQDGSLRDNGWEIVTVNDGQFGKDLSQSIVSMDELLKMCNRGAPVCNYRTAFHVHLDIRDMEAEEVHNMLFLYSLIEQPLFDWVGNDRKFSNFCVPWFRSDGVLDMFRSMVNPDNTFLLRIKQMQRYSAANVQSIAKYGSVEFRHMQNSTDELFTKQREFVQFTMQLKKLACDLYKDGIHGLKIYQWAKDSTPKELVNKFNYGMPKDPEWDYVEALMQSSQMFEFKKTKLDTFIDNYFVPFFGKHANWR